MMNLFNLDECVAKEEIEKYKEPWEIVPHISEIVESVINKINKNDFEIINGNVYIHKTCKVSNLSTLIGPCVILEESEIRPGAFIRGNVLVGKKCVIGNSCEIKNSIIFNEAQLPHYNYVGDSIIGYKAHFGAGAITSNLKSDRSNVVIKSDKEKIDTGLEKLGALVGDFVEVGCNTVLNPGTIIGKHTTVYPLSFVRGVVKENSIYKDTNNIVEKTKRA